MFIAARTSLGLRENVDTRNTSKGAVTSCAVFPQPMYVPSNALSFLDGGETLWPVTIASCRDLVDGRRLAVEGIHVAHVQQARSGWHYVVYVDVLGFSTC